MAGTVSQGTHNSTSMASKKKSKKRSAPRKAANRAIATVHADITIGEDDVKRAAKAVVRGTKKAAKKTVRRLKKMVS